MDKEDWLNLEQTKVLIKYLKFRRMELLETWASGGFTSESFDGTIQKNSEALGGVKELDTLISDIEDRGESYNVTSVRS